MSCGGCCSGCIKFVLVLSSFLLILAQLAYLFALNDYPGFLSMVFVEPGTRVGDCHFVFAVWMLLVSVVGFYGFIVTSRKNTCATITFTVSTAMTIVILYLGQNKNNPFKVDLENTVDAVRKDLETFSPSNNFGLNKVAATANYATNEIKQIGSTPSSELITGNLVALCCGPKRDARGPRRICGDTEMLTSNFSCLPFFSRVFQLNMLISYIYTGFLWYMLLLSLMLLFTTWFCKGDHGKDDNNKSSKRKSKSKEDSYDMDDLDDYYYSRETTV